MAGWPIIGRFVHISAAIIRLPELRAAYLDLNHRQRAFETNQDDLNRRQHAFETQQLPTVLQAISDLNHRQLNLVNSVPVALRRITRELTEIRGQLDIPIDASAVPHRETRAELENTSKDIRNLLARVEQLRLGVTLATHDQDDADSIGLNSIRTLLIDAGFSSAEVVAGSCEHGECKEFEIIVRRGRGGR